MSTMTMKRPEPICGSESMFPVPAKILEVHDETFNTHTFIMRIEDDDIRKGYRWIPGQFNMIYVPGVGEAAISISGDPREQGVIRHTIRIVGSVTRAIAKLGVGGLVGLRGPFGRGWPMEEIDGDDVVLVAGGIGLAPIRPAVYWLMANRNKARRVILLYGCRTPEDRLYVSEIEQWAEQETIDVLVTVDHPTGDWVGPVGVVTKLLQRIKVSADSTTVMVCGPRMLNRAAAYSFLQLHVPPECLFLSLERNMHCGYGQCGHCQYGPKFVCKDGPVFAFSEIADIFAKEEI